MTECDAPFGEIVRRKLERDLVACEHADSVATKSSSEMRQHDSIMLQLNAEQAAGKFLQNRPGYFYAVFLTHSTSER